MVISEQIGRLAPETRERARRALTGEWGQTLQNLPVALDEQPDLETLSREMRSARAIHLIAAHAPIRILPHQPIVGRPRCAPPPGTRCPSSSRASRRSSR